MKTWIKGMQYLVTFVTAKLCVTVVCFTLFFTGKPFAEPFVLQVIEPPAVVPSSVAVSSLEVGYLKAKKEMENNELKQADKRVMRLLKSYPKSAKLHYLSALINGSLAQQASIFSAGSYAKKSKNAFKKSIEVDPNFSPGYQGLVQFYLRAPAIAGGSNKKAKEIANKLMEVNPLQGLLSLILIAQDEDDDVLEAQLMTKLNNDFQTSPTALFVYGFYQQRLENFAQAYDAFKAATELTLSSSMETEEEWRNSQLSALYQLGRNAVFSNTHVEEGIMALEKYLDEQIPDGMPSKDWARYRLSVLHIASNQPAQAKPILTALKNGDISDDLRDLVKKELKKL